jgi:hypothetical protein
MTDNFGQVIRAFGTSAVRAARRMRSSAAEAPAIAPPPQDEWIDADGRFVHLVNAQTLGNTDSSSGFLDRFRLTL